MSRIFLWQLKIIDDCIAFERHLIVREMAQKPGIILGCGQLPCVTVAEFFKLWIKYENTILGITDVARLLIGATVLLAVTAHEIPDERINQRMRSLLQVFGFGPSTEAVKTLRT